LHNSFLQLIPTTKKVIMTKSFGAAVLLTAMLVVQLLFAPYQAAQAKQIMIFGDSLSAAYGLDIEQGWAHLLSEHLKQQYGDEHTIINASISGETTSGGLARLPLTLSTVKPDLVILELGANDGLRGHPIASIRENLEKMISLIQDSGAQIALAGISLPANYNPRYIDKFSAVFPDLAKQNNLPYINFYREEFLGNPEYIQEDGLHPTAITQPIIRDIMIDFFSQHSLLK